MNYNFFELQVNDDATVMECTYPLTSNLVMRKIVPVNNDLNVESNPCVYVIRRIDGENRFRYYIGQTIDGLARMRNHNNDDGIPYDFIYCALKSEQADLQAYLQCIETELIDRADKVKLSNRITKGGSKFCMPEYKQSIVRQYADAFIAMANVMGYKELFDQQQKRDNKDSVDWVAVKLSGKNGASAVGKRYPDNTLMVLTGSKCNDRADAVKNYANYESDCKLLDRLIETGSVDSELVFAEDILFDSPSQAARIVLGYSANGLDVWKTDEDLSLKKYLNRE